MTYVLHYAPDNASLIVRMALDTLGQSFTTQLVDRSTQGQRAPAYLALNPNGLIPTLITPQGPIFETGAILLWLVDRHAGLGPAVADATRADFLKWLFFCANTVHAQMALLFYPQKLVGEDVQMQHAVQRGVQTSLRRHFQTLNAADTRAFGRDTPTAIDLYIATLLRWCALYGPDDRAWFRLVDTPVLSHLCHNVEAMPAAAKAQAAEGLGPTPFTAPQRPNPPEGSAV